MSVFHLVPAKRFSGDSPWVFLSLIRVPRLRGRKGGSENKQGAKRLRITVIGVQSWDLAYRHRQEHSELFAYEEWGC